MLYKAKYISNKCSQVDEFANKPHESVANSLMSLLRDHSEIKQPVIGIEGSWGSGKSQVISILQRLTKEDKSEKKYLFHNYDIWSVQEDLTRRSFLDSLLNFSLEDPNRTYFKCSDLNEANLNKLNATTTIRSKKTFPVVRLFYGIALLIPATLFLITSIENLFGYFDNPVSYDMLRAFFGFSLMVAAMIVFVKELHDEYEKVKNDENIKDDGICNCIKISLSRILYVYKGKDIETDDYETIIKDEPSVTRFRQIFNDLKKSLKDGTTLVIVFDNMDRLSDRSKLMSVWTLLHTFFAESDNEGKIWAVVPYDKDQLASIMLPEGQKDKDSFTNAFLNKTFFTSFHIPEPIMTSWKQFLNEKLNEAFYPPIESEERNLVSLIFSRTTIGNISPRDIITFVNRLVTLYLQHHFEEIPLSALSIYSQFESKFKENSTRAILYHSGFELFDPLFNSREELTKQLASIYYNIKAQSAIEVVFNGLITDFLRSDYESEEEICDAFEDVSKNSAFSIYIEEYFNNENVQWENLKPENMFYLLKQENISNGTKNCIYIRVIEKSETVFDSDFSVYQPWMEWALLNQDLKNTNKLIQRIISLSNDSSFEDYQYSVVNLLLLKEKRDQLQVKPFKGFEVESVNDMMIFFNTLKENNATRLFKECGINISSGILLEYMKGGSSSPMFGEGTVDLYELLKLLALNSYNFSLVNDYIRGTNININSVDAENVERIYKVFDIINPIIKDVPAYTNYNSSYKDIPEYYAACIYKIKGVKDPNVIMQCFNKEYDKDILFPILTKYISLDEILYMSTICSSEILNKMSKDFVDWKTSRIDNIEFYLSNISKILEIISEDKFESLLLKLDSRVNDSFILKVDSIDDYWLSIISQKSIVNHEFCKILSGKLLDYVENLDGNEWTLVYKSTNSANSRIIILLEKEGLLSNEVWKKTDVFDAIREAYKGYIESSNSFCFDLFNVWKNYVVSSDIARVVNYVMDEITAPSKVKIENLCHFVELYISFSERLKDSKYADGFFDDYLVSYYKNCSDNSKLLFTIEKADKIQNFILLCDKTRQDKFVSILKELDNNIDDEDPNKNIILKKFKDII